MRSSRNGAPPRKGFLVNGRTTKASNKRARIPLGSPSRKVCVINGETTEAGSKRVPPALATSPFLSATASTGDRRSVASNPRRVRGGTIAIRRLGGAVDAGNVARHRDAGAARRVRVHAGAGRERAVPCAAALRKQQRPWQGSLRNRPPGAVQKDEEGVRC